MTDRRCVDCVSEGVVTKRPAPHGGPRSARCTTHDRIRRKRKKVRAHELRTQAIYGIDAQQYQALYSAQGGRCAICRKARGLSRKLAVDHEHHLCNTHPPDKGCPECIRALLCLRCNQLIGWFDVPALERAIDVLTNAPARYVLRDTKRYGGAQ